MGRRRNARSEQSRYQGRYRGDYESGEYGQQCPECGSPFEAGHEEHQHGFRNQGSRGYASQRSSGGYGGPQREWDEYGHHTGGGYGNYGESWRGNYGNTGRYGNESYEQGGYGGYGGQGGYGSESYEQSGYGGARGYGSQQRANYGRQNTYGGQRGYGSRQGYNDWQDDFDTNYGSGSYGNRGSQINNRGGSQMYGGGSQEYSSGLSSGGGSYGMSEVYGGGSRGYGRGGSQDYGSSGQYGQSAWDRSSQRNRGPKGYTRSDTRIEEDLNDRLMQQSRIDAGDIEVEVSNGEVTLKGTVESRQCKYVAEEIADSIMGVKDVHNQLRIQKQSSWSGEDDDSKSTSGSSRAGSTTSGNVGSSSSRSNTSESRTMSTSGAGGKR